MYPRTVTALLKEALGDHRTKFVSSPSYSEYEVFNLDYRSEEHFDILATALDEWAIGGDEVTSVLNRLRKASRHDRRNDSSNDRRNKRGRKRNEAIMNCAGTMNVEASLIPTLERLAISPIPDTNLIDWTVVLCAKFRGVPLNHLPALLVVALGDRHTDFVLSLPYHKHAVSTLDYRSKEHYNILATALDEWAHRVDQIGFALKRLEAHDDPSSDRDSNRSRDRNRNRDTCHSHSESTASTRPNWEHCPYCVIAHPYNRHTQEGYKLYKSEMEKRDKESAKDMPKGRRRRQKN